MFLLGHSQDHVTAEIFVTPPLPSRPAMQGPVSLGPVNPTVPPAPPAGSSTTLVDLHNILNDSLTWVLQENPELLQPVAGDQSAETKAAPS